MIPGPDGVKDMEFVRETTIRLYDTDAAGAIFFGAQFRLAHETFEDLAAHLGFSLADLLRERKYLFPVVHAAADFTAPLFTGDRVTIRAKVAKIGDRSFALHYRLKITDGREAGTVDIIHAAVDADTRVSIPVPCALRDALERFRDG